MSAYGSWHKNLKDVESSSNRAETPGVGITGMTAPANLEKVLALFSESAYEDSLTNDPFFDRESIFGPFINPLTESEKQEKETILQIITEIESQIARLKLEFSELSDTDGVVRNAFFGPQIETLEKEKSDLTVRFNSLVKKELEAYQEYEDAANKQIADKAQAQADEQKRIADRIADTEIRNAQDDKDDSGRASRRRASPRSPPGDPDPIEGLLSEGIDKIVRPEFERAARNYISDEPEIIFVSEYFVEGAFIGLLICFERYKGSTHYEVFKKSIFGSQATFRRILFLDSASLSEEVRDFVPYLHDTLGLKDLNPDKIFVCLDTTIKKDRIYEYSIAAARVPKSAEEVDYDLILEVEGRMKSTFLSGNADLFTYSDVVFGTSSGDLAWALAIVNEDVTFFGSSDPLSSVPLIDILSSDTVSPSSVLVNSPQNLSDLLSIYEESMSLFGVKNTFANLLQILGGLPKEVSESALKAVTDTSARFSYEVFREELKKVSPAFKILFESAASGNLDTLSVESRDSHDVHILLPSDVGTENITTILGLSLVLKFVNRTYIATTNAQQEDVFQELLATRDSSSPVDDSEDPLETSLQAQSAEVDGQTSETSTATQNLYSDTPAPSVATPSGETTISSAGSTVSPGIIIS